MKSAAVRASCDQKVQPGMLSGVTELSAEDPQILILLSLQFS